MTAIDPISINDQVCKARLFTRINKAGSWFQVLDLPWLTSVLKAAAGDNPRAQMKEIWRLLSVPLLAIVVFVATWAILAPTIQTSLGAVPGPGTAQAHNVKLIEPGRTDDND